MSDWRRRDLVDFRRIREIAAGDREFEVTLYRLFVDESRKNIMALGNALDNGQGEVIRTEAHTLKGASANTGATPLSELAEQLEEAAKAGDLQRVRTVFGEIQECFDRTVELLDATLEPGSF